MNIHILVRKLRIMMLVLRSEFVMGVAITNKSTTEFVLGDTLNRNLIMASVRSAGLAYGVKQEFVNKLIDKGKARESVKINKYWSVLITKSAQGKDIKMGDIKDAI